MSKDTQAAFRVTGSLHTSNGKGVVRMEGRYDTTIEDLWSALTEPQRLARWIATVDGELRVGGAFTAAFTSSWTGPGRVDVCEPPRHLLVTMSPGREDETVIVARLAADGDQTVLVLEERGLPLDVVAAHGAGWQAHTEDLAAHVGGRECADWHSRWVELTPAYREMTPSTD